MSAPRESLRLIAEMYDNNTHIQLGSVDGKELAFGALADSGDGEIELLTRLYYKKVTEGQEDDDLPMYYVVENSVPLSNIVYYIDCGDGDINGDGSVNIQDVTLLIDYLLGRIDYIDIPSADMNGDHIITLSDMTILIDWILSAI
jgi:hypothetical protein